jgi:hypothetical protein
MKSFENMLQQQFHWLARELTSSFGKDNNRREPIGHTTAAMHRTSLASDCAAICKVKQALRYANAAARGPSNSIAPASTHNVYVEDAAGVHTCTHEVIRRGIEAAPTSPKISMAIRQ